MPRRRTPADLLESHLHALARALRPEPDRVAAAHARAERLIAELHGGPAWMFEVVDLIPHGSHARGTALAGFSDYDALVVLNARALRTTRDDERTPRDTIGRMAAAIAARRAGLVAQGFLEARPQAHSVGVRYPQSGLRIDLVPARRHGRGLLIPSRERGAWISTYPGRAEARLNQACANLPHVRDAVRLIKAWRRARGSRLAVPSYALELLMVERAARGESLVDMVRGFFSEIAEHDKRYRLELRGSRANPPPMLVEDPDTGENVTQDLKAEHRRALVERCRAATSVLDDALDRLSTSAEARLEGALQRLFMGRG